LPTYRGIGGLYNQETTTEGISIEEAISGEMLQARPEVTWKYILQIERACRTAGFNRAHAVIAEMEKVFERVWVLTQNIDGFHQAAGSKNVIDIHGDIHDLRCLSCTYRVRVTDYSNLKGLPPRCPQCGGVLRPEVVLFGEMLPADKLAALERAWQQGFDMVFSVGTTSVFPYIARPVVEARRRGIPTVEINPGRTQVSDLVDLKIAGTAAVTLEQIWSGYHGKS
jgi:NAD-dependent deacetylase